MEKVKTILCDNFKQWFGNSIIKEENGQPLICSHISKSEEEIEIFDINRKDSIYYGIYFTHENKINEFGYLGNTNNVYFKPLEYKCYLKIENPFYIYDNHPNPNKDMLGNELIVIDPDKQYIQDIQSKGYDSLIIISSTNQQFIMLESNRIKSVYNKGSWLSEDENIYN